MSSRIRLELAQLSDSEFEQLVFALVVAEHREVDWRRVNLVRAPDGGVDVMFVGEHEGCRVGWQAKHVEEPKWSDWESSLDTARAEHSIGELTFVFPFNPTKGQLETFNDRLRGRHEDVAVEMWSLAHLEELLGRHRLVYERHLGRVSLDATLQIERLDRVIRAGGKIQDASDLLEHLKAISEALDARDSHFATKVVTGAAGSSGFDWHRLPYIELTLVVDEHEIVIATWRRDESSVELPSFGFTEDDAGRAARAVANANLSAGQPVVLRQGVWIGIKSPEILRELSRRGIAWPGFDTGRVQIPAGSAGGLRITPGDPVELDLVADPDGRALKRRFTARPVLPESPAAGEVVAIEDGIFVSLAFVPREGALDHTLSIGWRLDAGESAALLAAAEWVEAAIDSGLVLSVAGKLAEEQGGGSMPTDTMQAALQDGLELLRDLRLIEEHIGVDLPLPPREAVTEADIRAILGAAQALRTGRGTSDFRHAGGRVEAHQISGAAERMSGSQHVRDVDYVIFGRRIVIGRGRYTLPKLKLADVQALTPHPFGPARIWLEPEDDPYMEFELVNGGAIE